MNKFKLLSSSLDQQPQRRADGSNDQKQQRREEIHLLTILDKCTQILRDDRIWIRNRVKEMDPDILAIFRKSKRVSNGARMNESELHQLQVNLRKHVNRVKEKHKQEQLVRFKENLCSTNCLCEVERCVTQKNNRPTTISSKTNQTERVWQDDVHQRQEDGYRHSYDAYNQQASSTGQAELDSSTFNSMFKNKKKNLFDTLKLNEPIEQESEKETEKMSSYRSRSQQPQNRINYHFEEGYREGRQYPLRHDFNQSTDKKQKSEQNTPDRHETWLHNSSEAKATGLTPSKVEQPIRSNNWSMYNVFGQHPQVEHSVHFDQSKNMTYEYGGDSDRKDDRQPMLSSDHKEGLGGSVLAGLYAPLPKEEKKELFAESKYHPSFDQHFHSYENNYVIGSSAAASTKLAQHLELPKIPEYKPFEFSSIASGGFGAASTLSSSKPTYAGSGSISKPNPDNESLFTSPELLMECRKILQQSGEKKTTSALDSGSFSALPQLNFSAISSGATAGALSALSSLPGYQTTTSMTSSNFLPTYTLGALSSGTGTSVQHATSFPFNQSVPSYLPLSSEAGIHQVTHGESMSVTSNPAYDMHDGAHGQSFKERLSDVYQRNLVPEGKGFGKLLDNVAAKSCFSEVKEIAPRPKVPEEKVNPLANLMIVDSFEKESPGASRPSLSVNSPTKTAENAALAQLQDMTPEEVFDIFFFSEEQERNSSNMPGSSISLKDFGRTASANFRSTGRFQHIFEMCDKGDRGYISCLEFGKALDKLLNSQSKPQSNPIREIFSLIDIKQKGYFTLEDYQRFLEQVLESEQQNYQEVARLAYRLFELADLAGSKQVEYWGLYLARETEEFQSFSEYLEQFEFEVEI